ncbi:KilA-N domain-containing protein [Mucilaginibacter sp.]|uniref:KilA-N domain-containing protein n=1 Tax=Mucilaginibacter sp. TaxID=1882438 RepID=UPI002614B4D2|nr:KilA-N domain-containing protein [Mucilaginibacter sp.]MDB4925798.1 KilA-N protein [Mucilaginibacter sp.]
MSKITVDNTEITVITEGGRDFICLTDMMKSKDGDFFLTDWLRNKNTLDYISVWERLNNPDFNYGEFAIITSGAGRNSFKVSVKDLVEKCNVKSITSKAGRYGGTYGHKDIAFHFGMWISAEFQLLLVTEYQRLKEEETKRLNSEWDYRRFLSKANYSIHTDAVKNHVIPSLHVEKDKEWIVYANEADLLSVAVFGYTAKQWKEANPKLHLQGLNMRDIADAHQLLVLSNLEGYNAILIGKGIDKYQRLVELRKAAVSQLASLRASIYTEDKIRSPYLPSKKTTEPVKPTFGALLGAVANAGKPPKEDN